MDRCASLYPSRGDHWRYTVIAGGSVVTKDIPANVIAAGNPCRVIREITEADRNKYRQP